MWAGRDHVIETAMLESLAMIAAANQRSLIEELNLAIQAYVLEQMPVRSPLQRLNRVLSESSRAEDRSS